jgi:hypothetical protein
VPASGSAGGTSLGGISAAGLTTPTTTPTAPTLPGTGSPTTTTPPTTAPPSSGGSGGGSGGSGGGSGGGSTGAGGGNTSAGGGSGSGGSGGAVPNVPTGGPPTTAPPKPGAPPPPPPDPKPILAAVDADMTQLTAISEYPQAVNDVSLKQQAVTAAVAGVQSAQAVLKSAQKAQDLAASRSASASQRLAHLAIAAYIGLGYDSPGGLNGPVGTDAQEMLRIVAVHVRNDVARSRQELDKAKQATQKAAGGVKQAEAGVSAAQAALQASQAAVAVLTKAATVPGVAAQIGLLGLPNLDGSSPPAGSPGPSGGSQAAGAKRGQPLPGAVDAVASQPATPVAPSILGAPLLTANDLAAWYASTGHTPNITVPMSQLAADYATAGAQTGVRYDVAFAQSIVETGYFTFPAGGQLAGTDNNFAGIGACDSCAHGWHFPDALTGVTAQLQLLEAYAKPNTPTPLIGSVGVGGCCPNWMALAGKWATSTVYGISIMTVYQQMLAWAIPQKLTAAGLTAPPAPPVAVGPTLAKLPPSGSH